MWLMLFGCLVLICLIIALLWTDSDDDFYDGTGAT